MIYYILDVNQSLVKIGYTTNLQGRCNVIQSQSPQPLLLIGAHWGELASEAIIHRMFSHLRVRGEWFRFTDEIMSYIESRHDPETLDEEYWLTRSRTDIASYFHKARFHDVRNMPYITVREYIASLVA